MIRQERYTITLHDGTQNVRVTVHAPSIVLAITDVCDTQNVPHRAVIEARKVR